MKVYILTGYYEYEGSEVIKVYSSHTEAKLEADRLNIIATKYYDWLRNDATKDDYELPEHIIEPDSMHHGYIVEEYEVV